MKQCPTCNRTYADETLTYCLADGSLLSAPYDPEATQRIPPPRTTNQPPTDVFHSNHAHSEQMRRAGNPALPYIIVALLALIVGGGVVALLKSKDKDTPLAQSSTSLPTTITNQEQVKVNEEPKTNPSQNTASPSLTVDTVNSLINRWVIAQNAKDLAAYQSCYGASFEGVKRTASGRLSYYDFNAWMKDRRRMISEAVGLNIEIRNMHVSIDGDVATVEFDQYYRSRKYSDWGPKTMKVKLTPIGERIVYEELKASYPL
jgi:ketosteroid isomerase-like protein